jgi:hypothetical protein
MNEKNKPTSSVDAPIAGFRSHVSPEWMQPTARSLDASGPQHALPAADQFTLSFAEVSDEVLKALQVVEKNCTGRGFSMSREPVLAALRKLQAEAEERAR